MAPGAQRPSCMICKHWPPHMPYSIEDGSACNLARLLFPFVATKCYCRSWLLYCDMQQEQCSGRGRAWVDIFLLDIFPKYLKLSLCFSTSQSIVIIWTSTTGNNLLLLQTVLFFHTCYTLWLHWPHETPAWCFITFLKPLLKTFFMKPVAQCLKSLVPYCVLSCEKLR